MFGLMSLSAAGWVREKEHLHANPAEDLCKISQRVRVFRSVPFQTLQRFHRRKRRTGVKGKKKGNEWRVLHEQMKRCINSTARIINRPLSPLCPRWDKTIWECHDLPSENSGISGGGKHRITAPDAPAVRGLQLWRVKRGREVSYQGREVSYQEATRGL